MKTTYGLLFLALLLGAPGLCAQKHPLDYVNMTVGTTGKHRTEYGGTTPAVSEPFGMTQWCAATRLNGISRTMYHYDDHRLIGFMATHQPAIWMGDYGFLTLMPQTGKLKITPEQRGVALDHAAERATPYAYAVSYKDGSQGNIGVEFTATSRCSFFRIAYPAGEKALLFLEAGREKEGGSIEIDPANNEIRICNRERHDSHLGPPLYNLKGCYVLRFSQPFTAYGTWNGTSVHEGRPRTCGSAAGGYVEFAPGTELVEIRIGSSFIDHAQAAANLDREIPQDASFADTRDRVRDTWARALEKATLKGAPEEDMHIFYTAFFRTLQYPREFSEYGRYYSAFDDRVHDGVSYNAYSLWDTFRAQHPWLLLMAPERIGGMVTALVQMYHEGGWIPKWPNPSYTNIMIGTHADAVIADAYVNGYRDYDVEEAYRAIRKNAFTPPDNDEQYRWGDRHFWNGCYEARGGLTNYLRQGFVASDKANESVARTLEFALDDYCIAQMAEGLGHTEDAQALMQRTQNYRKLYDPETGFFRARRSDGEWDRGDEGFTEGANWTYRFCVMQDPKGMIELMDGPEAFMRELDRNFDEGHYRHDNEPGHHYVYLYNHCGRLDKTQQRIPGILAANYKNRPDGLSGNDDCGQMSAWYLFSSLGFYPLTPASGEYALGIPRFPEATLELPNGKRLTIKAKDLHKSAVLTRVFFNGRELETPFVKVRDILGGGTLEFLPAKTPKR